MESYRLPLLPPLPIKVPHKEKGHFFLDNKDSSCLYGISGRKMIDNMKILNWSKNRPPDLTRIPLIVKSLKKQKYIDGMIYLARDENNNYYCYDGIHRIEALRMLYREEYKIDHRVIIHIIDTYDEDYIEKKFKLLNKCIPVPEIYTEAEHTLHCIELIEYVVGKTFERFSRNFSPSNRPQKIHENRDRMIDKLTEFLQNNIELQYFTKEQLYDLCIKQFNLVMKKLFEMSTKRVKLTQKQRKKCIETQCYLFIYKNWEEKMHDEYYKGTIKIKRGNILSNT